jgi:hypothetical protein
MPIHGTLTGFDEDHKCFIDGKEHDMFDAAAGFLKKNWPRWKQTAVEAEIRDGKISLITQHQREPTKPVDVAGDLHAKLEKNGFTTLGKIDTCTSSKAPELVTVAGQISMIDQSARKIVIKDKDGISHPFEWAAPKDPAMSKLQQYWFTKITAEGDRVVSQEFFRRPDDWPASHGGSGWNGDQPRNQKMIVVQTILKAYCELWINTNTPDQVTFADAREEILSAVEADLPRVLKAGGVL